MSSLEEAVPDLGITKCVDKSGNVIEGAVVIAFSQDDLLSNISHTESGSDFPPMAYTKANVTNHLGQCVIAVPGGSQACISFASPDSSIGSECITHVSMVA